MPCRQIYHAGWPDVGICSRIAVSMIVRQTSCGRYDIHCGRFEHTKGGALIGKRNRSCAPHASLPPLSCLAGMLFPDAGPDCSRFAEELELYDILHGLLPGRRGPPRTRQRGVDDVGAGFVQGYVS